MRFYRPKFQLAALQPPQDRLVSKLGGRPWGFPQSRWSICSDCGDPMSMVAQLEHALPMIDLGVPGSVLHLFYCANMLCMSYGDPTSCEAVVLRCEEISSGLTEQPLNKDGEQVVNDEVWIAGWGTHDDPVTLQQLPSFYHDQAHRKLPEEIAHPYDFDLGWYTKAGGAPYWTGHGVTLDPSHTPFPPFELLLQIHETVYLEGEVPVEELVDNSINLFEHTSFDRVAYCVNFANLGTGTGFIFIDRSSTPPLVRWHWSP
ncbi:hypothetical protein SAMN03159496_03603 [Rhizobium sp. NFR07]|jgi:hypothetical protein|uniref:hypothetical protein n=1 Tax=Rhizobium sp. NFR07 TaxID=1566262 RepID=UPI0008E19D21|nr:hypothetical protein [Rhizobium sp. NFR07]SFB42631.1 hypothetical protein SAMN03159496_03603 [Rhizobium sp. NFR07]